MFRSPAILEVLPQPGRWRVSASLVWALRDDLRGAITVPVGFVTDLASVPRFLRDRRAFDVNGRSRRPAILHDYLYATGKGGKDFADDLFREALLAEGVGALNAWAFWKAVQWGGHGPYREHATRRAAGVILT